MGKGSRSRAIRAQEKIENPKKFEKRQRKSAPKWIAPVVALVIVLAIAVGVVFSVLNNSGVILRSKTAVTSTDSAGSENFTVTGTMMSVYYNSTVQSYKNRVMQQAYYYYYIYGSSLNKSMSELYTSFLGFNEGKALHKQVKDEKANTTWFDYFMDSTKNSVTQMLTWCEAAKAAGFQLSEEDLKDIDEQIASMEKNAKEDNMSLSTYLKKTFGTGVKESDFREAYRLQLLASKFEEKVHDDIDNAITEEDIEKYFDDHATEFSMIKIFSYSASTKEDNIKEAALKLKEITTTEEFRVKFREFLELDIGDYETEEEKQEALDSLMKKAEKTISYSDTDDDYQTWMFTKEWKGDTDKNPGTPEAGKTIVVEDTKNNKCTIYHIISMPEKDTTLIEQNVSYLPITDLPKDAEEGMTLEDYAKKLFAEFEAGEKNADTMKALDPENYKNIASYSTSGVGVTNVDNWIKEAKIGDYKLIKASIDSTEEDKDENSDKKDVYYLVMVHDAKESWHSGCRAEVKEEREDAWYKEASEKCSVNFNKDVCDNHSNFD